MTLQVLLGHVAEELTAFEEGFLVGLIEGEGCIGLRNSTKRSTPCLRIINTDKDLIDYARSLLEKIGCHTNVYTMTHKGWKSHWKTRYDLDISGIDSTRQLLPLLQKLVSTHRRNQLDAILKIIDKHDKKVKRWQDRESAILNALLNGAPTRIIASELKITQQYVYIYLNRRGFNINDFQECSTCQS